MKDNLKELLNIPNILEVKRLFLDYKVKQNLDYNFLKKAENNSKRIFVYRIIYKSNGKKIVGYIVEPKKGKDLPCIIWNRGGSRDFGAIRVSQLFGGFSTIASLALQGYVVIATQYPGVDGGEGLDNMGSEDDIDSILDLYKILKKYKRADSKNVGMYGHSRGAMMTYMCLTKVNWLKAAVAISGPTDEINSPKFRKGWEEHQVNMYGGSKKDKKKRSAIYFADKISSKTPLLIMHGTSDWRVNPLDSINLAHKLQENKKPYRLIMYEGADHGLTEVYEHYTSEAINWFNRFIKNKEKFPNLKPHGF